MQAAPQNNNIFDPVHDAHSIEQVAFVVQFDRFLEDEVFKAIVEDSSKFEQQLPAKSMIQNFAIAFGSPNTPPPNLHGAVSYRKFAANGTLDTELRVERNSFTYVTTSYTRWNPSWLKAKEYLEALLVEYIKHARVSTISLSYTDKYIWRGTDNEFRPNLLIDETSNFVSHNIFNIEDFWHSHTGAFYKVSPYVKRLLNFNVDALEEPIQGKMTKVVALTTVLTDMLDQPGYEALGSGANLVAVFNDSMQSMHNFSKDILKGTLTTEVQRRIGLL